MTWYAMGHVRNGAGMASSDLDLKNLSDAQLAALVRALHADGEDEPAEIVRFLEHEIAQRKRRGELQ
jgi:hypothetical protein